MKVLITGKGTSGSWQIRGVQLGSAMGATVMPHAPLDVMRSHDVVILVKRTTPQLLSDLKACRRPVVWDVVDAWSQPVGNGWGRAAALHWLSDRIRQIRPQGVVCATRAMQADVAALVPELPALTLPHHHRPGLEPVPIRPVKVIAYEGGDNYPGRWATLITEAAAVIGAEFVVNPPSLSVADAVVAVREACGYPVMQWKSNVKQANAHALGLPFIAQKEAGYVENASGSELWINDESSLRMAICALRNQERLNDSRKQGFNSLIPLHRVSSTYLHWLTSLLGK